MNSLSPLPPERKSWRQQKFYGLGLLLVLVLMGGCIYSGINQFIQKNKEAICQTTESQVKLTLTIHELTILDTANTGTNASDELIFYYGVGVVRRDDPNYFEFGAEDEFLQSWYNNVRVGDKFTDFTKVERVVDCYRGAGPALVAVQQQFSEDGVNRSMVPNESYYFYINPDLNFQHGGQFTPRSMVFLEGAGDSHFEYRVTYTLKLVPVE